MVCQSAVEVLSDVGVRTNSVLFVRAPSDIKPPKKYKKKKKEEKKEEEGAKRACFYGFVTVCSVTHNMHPST